ncbi:MAG: hypothetical protein IJY04_07410 [Clostridia bacterium]|nr:hypothetical protein [Clostridia bacterium]
MGWFNRGAKAAEGIRKSLEKYGITADIDLREGCVFAVAYDVIFDGSELSISLVRKNLELEFKLGTDPRFYQALSDFVTSYNDSQPPFSRAELGDPEKAHRPEYHNAWIEGYVPGARVSDNAEEAKLFLDIILEDIFVTHASLLRSLCNRSSASGQL